MRLLALVYLLVATNAGADWRVRPETTTKTQRITALRAEISNGKTQASLILASFAPSMFRFQIDVGIDHPAASAAGAASRLDGVAAINGGYFQGDDSPVGLLVSSGQIIKTLKRARLLSGVFVVREGKPEIVRTNQLGSLKGIRDAVQSGPFLLDGGQPVPGLDDTRVAARSFVFTTADNRIGLGVCRSVTLAQLAELLAAADIASAWRISRALNLDGGSSTDFFLRVGETDFSSPGLVSVRDYLVVTALDAR
jgi:exopolysaccharide biosynthesis protein